MIAKPSKVFPGVELVSKLHSSQSGLFQSLENILLKNQAFQLGHPSPCLHPLYTHPPKPSLLGNLDTCVCQDLLQNIQLLKDLKCCTKQRSLPSFQFFKKISSSLRFSCFLLFFFFSSSHSFFYFFLLFLLF